VLTLKRIFEKVKSVFTFLNKHAKLTIITIVVGFFIYVLIIPEGRHILYRELLHMIGAAALGDCFYFFIRYLQRQLRTSPKLAFIGESPKPVLILSGILPGICTLWREPFDVAMGGWAPKSTIDMIVWFAAGLVFSSWKIYRLKYKD